MALVWLWYGAGRDEMRQTGRSHIMRVYFHVVNFSYKEMREWLRRKFLERKFVFLATDGKRGLLWQKRLSRLFAYATDKTLPSHVKWLVHSHNGRWQ
jgi:hypothetical protein